jgi:DNA/RNA endonuclease YhcR with UshA esterase domain
MMHHNLPTPNKAPEPDGVQVKKQSTLNANCPSCGRFVGPYSSCPFCGAAMEKRLSLKLVKIFALCFATVGLDILWLLARRTEIPHVVVAEIGSLMNMAYVRIDGHITRAITYDPTTQYMGFWVDDGTGEIHVSVYRDTTQELLQMGVIPALGDKVSIAGSLRIREDYAALTLDIPAHLKLTRPAPAALKSSDITPLDEGRRVVLQGEVASITTPYTGLTLLKLKDNSGNINITVNNTIQALTGDIPEVNAGQFVMVTGTVTLYKGTPQVALCSSEEITVQPNPPESEPDVPEVRQLSHISLTDLGSQVLVKGRIVAMDGIKGGLKAVLDDKTAQIIIVFWSQVYNSLDEPAELDLGAEITVYGEVSAYQGVLEVIPQKAADISIDTPAPEIPWVSIKALTREDVGELVRVRGLLGTPEGFSSGVKIPLKDGSGRITVLLWSNIYQELKPRPVEDMLTEVTGIIDIYNGVLEIIPRSTYDVINLDQLD